MIPNRDLDALERWVLSAGGPQESLVSDALLRALAELRATRSQLAESQRENAGGRDSDPARRVAEHWASRTVEAQRPIRQTHPSLAGLLDELCESMED